MRRTILCALVLLLGGLAAQAQSTSIPGPAAQAAAVPGQQPDRLAKIEQQVAEARSSGDNAWMLVSSALVLMMTGPGLALFYGGLVRPKNVLGTMMQSFILMALITVLWAFSATACAFTSGSRFIGRSGLHVSARRRRRARRRLRRHDPPADLHGLPVDVRHHHSGAHHRRLCRADEVQRHGGCS